MPLYDDLKAAIAAIIAQYKAAVADKKLTFGEVFGLFTSATGTFVKLAQQYLKELSGAERKQAVLDALALFYDQVIAPIDIKVIPNIVEPMVDKALRALLLAGASGLIDALVNIFNRTGWDDVTPDPVVPEPQPTPEPKPDGGGDFKPFKAFCALPA